MIRDYEFFHGAALAKLVRSGGRLIVAPFKGSGNAAYLVNDRCGLYLKHSTSRMSPWAFTFLRDHQLDIDGMQANIGCVVIGLICNDDGVVGLEYAEFRTVLDASHEEAEGVVVTRKPRGMYRVKGHDGKMQYRIGEGEFVKKVLRQGTLDLAS
jgi:hypothetical protein